MADSPLAVFRCDGGPNLGSGHVMRCLGFAARLRDYGWTTKFAVSDETTRTMTFPESQRTNIIPVDETDQPVALGQKIGGHCELLVIDHYQLDYSYERACRNWSDRLIAIDDLANRRHECDVLTDFTPGRKVDAYKGKIPDRCSLYLGPSFAPLRRDFFHRRVEESPHSSIRQRPYVLISLGATDPNNFTCRILNAIKAASLDVTVTVALDGAAPHLAAVENRLSEVNGTLLVDTPDMAQEMSAADFIVGAAGTSAWERCCLGKATLMLVAGVNQRANAAFLSTCGAVRLLDEASNDVAFAIALTEMIEDPVALKTMGAKASELCDGLGGARLILAAGAAPKAKDAQPVCLRPVCDNDLEKLLNWQQHPDTRRYARNPQAPTLAEHNNWFASKRADRHCIFNIITHGDNAAGLLRFDYKEDLKGFEISIVIAPDLHGLGIATQALRLGRVLLDDWNIYAYVNSANGTSLRLFKKAVYICTGDKGWFVNRATVLRMPADKVDFNGP